MFIVAAPFAVEMGPSNFYLHNENKKLKMQYICL